VKNYFYIFLLMLHRAQILGKLNKKGFDEVTVIFTNNNATSEFPEFPE